MNDPKPLTREEVEKWQHLYEHLPFGTDDDGNEWPEWAQEFLPRLCADWLRMEAAITDALKHLDGTGAWAEGTGRAYDVLQKCKETR